jgi:dTDP-4-amino-4,6-dideoxygalactose transaminase
VPTFTFCATATAIERTGARAVLADIDPSDLMTTVEHCRRMFSLRTRAIMVVHYGGSCIDLRAMRAMCDDHGIHLLEDAAQALGAARDESPAGSVGTMAAFSFHETKIAHCGHGGALVVNSTCPKLLRRIDEIINRGTDFSIFASEGSSHYQWVGHGGSFELSELQAALLASQLQALPRIISSRQAISARYSASLADLAESGLMAFLKHRGTNNGHVFAVLMRSAKAAADLISHCNAEGIQAQSHYMPLHLSRAGRRLGAVATCPNATESWNRLVRLPIHTEMTFDDVDRVVDAVREHVAPARRNAA